MQLTYKDVALPRYKEQETAIGCAHVNHPDAGRRIIGRKNDMNATRTYTNKIKDIVFLMDKSCPNKTMYYSVTRYIAVEFTECD